MQRNSSLLRSIAVSATYMFLAVGCVHAAGDLSDVPAGLTEARARSLIGVAAGLMSFFIGGLAMARSMGRLGNGSGRLGAIIALLLGLAGLILGALHLAQSTGVGTGGGRLGAIVALVLALLGTSLGGLALARRARSSK